MSTWPNYDSCFPTVSNQRQLMTSFQNIYINTKEQAVSGAKACYLSDLLVLWRNSEPSELMLLFVVSRFVKFSRTWTNPQKIPGAEWFNRDFIASLHHASVGVEKYEQLTSTAHLTLLNKCQSATEVLWCWWAGTQSRPVWTNTIKQLFLFRGPDFLPTSRARFHLKWRLKAKKREKQKKPQRIMLKQKLHSLHMKFCCAVI